MAVSVGMRAKFTTPAEMGTVTGEGKTVVPKALVQVVVAA